MATLTYQVSAPAPPVPLASLENFKSDLKITDNAQDIDLARHLLGASDAVLSYIRRPIIFATWRDVIELHPENARIALTLGRYPLVSIAALSVNGTLMSADDVAALCKDTASGQIYPADGAPSCLWQPGRYVVTYTAGYIPPAGSNPGTIPPAIQRAVLIAASASWLGATRDPNLRQESEQGVGSTSFAAASSGAGGLPQQAADLLGSYRKSGGIR